jgi:membrane associated rhomboid family serine protease
MPPLLPITRNLMIACLVVLCLEQIPALGLFGWFALWPVVPGLTPIGSLGGGSFMPWQLLTYAFMHAPRDPTHLIFNMLGLFMFGSELESIWGPKRYLQFLGASVLAGALVFLLFSLLLQLPSPTIGSSSALFGLLLANGLLFPQRPIGLFMVIPTNMRTAVIVFAVLELLFGVYGGVGSFASTLGHLGGALGGYLMLLWWRRRPPSHRRKTTPLRRVH